MSRRIPTLLMAMLLLTAVVAPRARAEDSGRDKLNTLLRQAQADRDDTTQALPMLTLGAGILAMAVGLGVGAGAALSCEGSCNMPKWVGPTIIAGGALSSLGTVWWLNTNRHQTELDRHIARVRDELHALELRESPSPAAGSGEFARVRFDVRFVF